MSESESGLAWQGVSSDALCWLELGDEVLVYHSGSGDTHLLDTLSASVLRLVCDRPLTLARLTALLADRPGIPRDELDGSELAALMKRFRRLGLVDVVKPC